MSDHLPECMVNIDDPDIRLPKDSLICPVCVALRACEERVKSVQRPLSFLKGSTYGRDCGWSEALDAAEAVVAEIGSTITFNLHDIPAYEQRVLDAIRALKEKP